MKLPMRIHAAVFIVLNLAVCSAAFAAEAEVADKDQSVFSGSMGEALWTVIVFGALVFVLGKYAWRPLLETLKEREEHIRGEIATAETARKQAEKTLAEYNSRIDQLEQEGRHISERAEKEAQKRAAEIAEKALQEATALKQKAQSDIDAAHSAARKQLWDEAGEIVLALGSRVLGRTISAEDNQKLIDEAIGKLKAQS